MDVVPLSERDLPSLSNRLEKVIEYQFLADVTAELLRRDLSFDVMRGEVDAFGHDIVIEVDGAARHIQLKAVKKKGKRREVTVNINLTKKPSGCIIWIYWNPDNLRDMSYRWFGGSPGEPLSLPDGAPIAKNSRSSGDGTKKNRNNHRVLKKSEMEEVKAVTGLVDRLFGPAVRSTRLADLAEIVEADESPSLHKAGRQLGDHGPRPGTANSKNR